MAIAGVFQNEAPFLKEWIEFHKLVGVEHFVLIDDNSTDDYLATLQPYIEKGEVEVERWACPDALRGRRFTEYQRSVYQSLLAYFRGIARWVAFIDIDEFIVPSEQGSIPRFLREHEEYGAIYVHWEQFGTSYISKLSEGELMTSQLTMKRRFEKGRDVFGKSIVKPHCAILAEVHECKLIDGFRYLDTNPGMLNEQPQIKIHHYWSRDEQYLFGQKLPRAARLKGWDFLEGQEAYFRALFNEVADHTMARYSTELHARVLG
ncbi:MAG: glycosyltransferase family 92 protein [Candidatus Eremiobacteraeota bacterium]|nr:glycosyltransferase family 92 protein [Candidatus Eremiobacteraeota bacterium]